MRNEESNLKKAYSMLLSSLVYNQNYKLPKYFSLHQQSLEQNIHFMHKVNSRWKCEVIAPLLTY